MTDTKQGREGDSLDRTQLKAAREALTPGADRRLAVRNKVTAALALSAAGTASVATVAKGAVSSAGLSVGASGAMKLGLSALALAVGTAAVFVSSRGDEHRPLHPTQEPAAQQRGSAATQETQVGRDTQVDTQSELAEVLPRVTQEPPSINPLETVATTNSRQRAGDSRSADRAVLAAEPAPSALSIADEARILSEANRALEGQNYIGVERLLSEHRQRFPRGQLTEERDAIQVMSSCESGESAAMQLLERFIARYPNSLQRDHVESICARR